MTALARVAWFEYRRHFLSRRFIVMTAGLPLFVALLTGLSVAVARRVEAGAAAGWAVVGGVLPDTRPMADEAAASRALAAGELAGYVVLLPGGRAEVHGPPPPRRLSAALRDRSWRAILSEVPAAERGSVAQPVELMYASLSGSGPISGTGLAVTILLALALPLLFLMAVLLANSFLILAVTEEKAGRVLEILLTSVSPMALIAGKVVGLSLLSLTQALVWLASGVLLGLWLARPTALPAALPWGGLAVGAVFFALGYLLYATIMVGIGIVIGQPREAQQVAGLLSLALVLPFLLAVYVLAAPGSPVAVVLSLFPLSAPVIMPMRLILSAVPWPQLVAGLTLSAGTLLLAASGVGRLFRASMLLYGQRLSWGGVVAALRG